MSLTARNRIEPVDFLHEDYEYVTIYYYAEGSRNSLGEPSRTLTQRATDVKCSLQQLVRLPTYVSQAGILRQLRQGLEHQTVYYMILSANQTIEHGDRVDDYDSVRYEVLHVHNWFTHKEAFLRLID